MFVERIMMPLAQVLVSFIKDDQAAIAKRSVLTIGCALTVAVAATLFVFSVAPVMGTPDHCNGLPIETEFWSCGDWNYGWSCPPEPCAVYWQKCVWCCTYYWGGELHLYCDHYGEWEDPIYNYKKCCSGQQPPNCPDGQC